MQSFSYYTMPTAICRMMFFDFSNAFNTIQPAWLGNKLPAMQVQAPLISWILDYLSDVSEAAGFCV